jgi:hypothetical protein
MKMKHFFSKSKHIAIQSSLIIFITLVMVEITFSIYHYFNPTFIFYSNSYNRFRGKPHADNYNFKLNSLGFKDKEFTDKKDNVYRIIGIGDSFTFGIVPYEYNYLTLLESKLQGLGYNIEILNMGIPGMGPKEYLSLFVMEGLKLKPDMLLLSFYIGNDFEDCLKAKNKWYYYSNVTSFIYYLITISYNYEGIAYNGNGDYCDNCPSGDKKTYLKALGEQSFIYLDGNNSFKQSLNIAVDYLSAINDICKKENIEFVVVLIPDELQINRIIQKEIVDIFYPKINQSDWNITLPNTMLSDRLTKLGIKFIDLFIPFSTNNEEQLYKPRDTHWNIAGNRLAANIIKEHLAVFFRENPKSRYSLRGQKQSTTVTP